MKDEAISLNPQMIDSLKELKKTFAELEAKKVQSFVDFLTATGLKEIADQVKSNGLPVQIFCGKSIYPAWKTCFNQYSAVVDNRFIEEDQVVFSWIKESNPWDAWDLINSKKPLHVHPLIPLYHLNLNHNS